MKKIITIAVIILCSSSILYAYIISDSEKLKIYYKRAHTVMLPSNFPVYVSRSGRVINHKARGFQKIILPTSNKFKGFPGCYVACYSRSKKGSVYSVGSGIFVMGQVRVKGTYDKRICKPQGHEYRDISAMSEYKQLCDSEIFSCNSFGCWAGGDTGGWYGIQSDGTVAVSGCNSCIKNKMKLR